MAKRRCRDCPTLIPADAYKGRCTSCNRAADKQRGTRQARGYGANHQAARQAIQNRIDAGDTVTCWRCHIPLAGRAWHLDHTPDRQGHRGPACPSCNLTLAGLAAHAR